jgi:site-specific DNA-cytosine methylase
VKNIDVVFGELQKKGMIVKAFRAKAYQYALPTIRNRMFVIGLQSKSGLFTVPENCFLQISKMLQLFRCKPPSFNDIVLENDSEEVMEVLTALIVADRHEEDPCMVNWPDEHRKFCKVNHIRGATLKLPAKIKDSEWIQASTPRQQNLMLLMTHFYNEDWTGDVSQSLTGLTASKSSMVL